MAHGPSPFGVPQETQAHRPPDNPGFDWSEYDERSQMRAPTARLSPEDRTPTVRLGTRDRPPTRGRRSPEEEMEEHLDQIQASRPLRRAAQRARRRTRWWLVALVIVSALAVVAACAAGAFIVLREGEPDPSAPSAQAAADQPSAMDGTEAAPEVVDPIASRATDTAPITVEELFGANTITPAGGAGDYKVLETEELSNCADAGLDELAELLADADCTQTVRATLINPDGEYAATAGVLNLADTAEADALRAEIEAGLEGGFAALRTDGEAEELGRAATMVGYNTYGHYLMYVVIGRTDGEPIEEASEPVRAIVSDLVDVWFIDQLNPRRDVQ
ncbi:hypothetical protein [Glycomyces algeriensis]|uniref:Uncharacterized protein n=1 Tax=Glycomyces algeriensis TaxID=256037 RepID=A0A9W6GBG0_9ACTN|nr:hypothetical protein [Glycomyces algeriensis]MDA1366567.1 hypothetical protein [Glycomyces algeriensis]MDR7352225.1 hypothetical protein [Glycomyces algeriensis]GLI44960.1 hypothetical protein GALLR39Z86_48100 [Glycomyces algeriensis]